MKSHQRQVTLLHISDLHFGAKHICNPAVEDASSQGIPSIEQLIYSDLVGIASGDITEMDSDDSLQALSESLDKIPMRVCITGDFTEHADAKEFQRAKQFLQELTKLLRSRFNVEQIHFIPGNHDVLYENDESEARMSNFRCFYNEAHGLLEEKQRRVLVAPGDVRSLSRFVVTGRPPIVVAEINSCLHVCRATRDSIRGQVDLEDIKRLRRELESVPRELLRDSLKVAIIHHHPVLLPFNTEEGKGYDAVLGSSSLVNLLRKNGFHIVLHGHKHKPYLFTYDAFSPCSASHDPPLLLVAGGSVGSTELPSGTGVLNTYNIVSIKWQPKASFAQAMVLTRGLKRMDTDGILDPDQWEWKSVACMTRAIGYGAVGPREIRVRRLNEPREDEPNEIQRRDEYARLRGNMLVVEVTPCFVPGQEYEARVWIESHGERELPFKVIWNAGTKFSRVVVKAEDDPRFCTKLQYYGPMLVQGRLVFRDGTAESAYIYARMPQSHFS